MQVDIYMHMGNSLNVAHLYDVYEDDSCVDLIMERCLGGDLWTRIRKGDYSEEGVLPACIVHRERVWAPWLLLPSVGSNALRLYCAGCGVLGYRDLTLESQRSNLAVAGLFSDDVQGWVGGPCAPTLYMSSALYGLLLLGLGWASSTRTRQHSIM